MMNIHVHGGELAQAELDAYIAHCTGKHPGKALKSLDITLDGDFVDLNYELEAVPFERIRRITGYLVGTVERFNNAKQKEEQDRVKHSVA